MLSCYDTFSNIKVDGKTHSGYEYPFGNIILNSVMFTGAPIIKIHLNINTTSDLYVYFDKIKVFSDEIRYPYTVSNNGLDIEAKSVLVKKQSEIVLTFYVNNYKSKPSIMIEGIDCLRNNDVFYSIIKTVIIK